MKRETDGDEGVYHRFPCCPFCRSYRVKPGKREDNRRDRTRGRPQRYRCLDCSLSFTAGENPDSGPVAGGIPPRRLLAEIRPYFLGLLLVILLLLVISFFPALF